jgi:hypothetical protein
MDNEYFNSYISSVTSSRAIVRSAMTLLERQDDMLRMMYLNRSASRQEAALLAQQNRQANQDNTIANIFAQAILNRIGNMEQMSRVVVRPSQMTVELATENILFSDIPSNIDRYQRCPISHDNFQASTPITRIRQCGHYFEREAIATWFQTSCICPICRADIREGVADNSDHDEEIVVESNNSVGSADGVADNSDHNEEIVVESNNSVGSADGAALYNNSNTMSTVRTRNITDILSMLANAGEMEDAAGDTISYQLEFVPVLQNVPTPQSFNDRQIQQNFVSMMNDFRNSINSNLSGSR